jgi:hypothetical protein
MNSMRLNLSSFASGVVFATGLGISGMTRPVKVIGFLDFFGDWDPSLALVMAGAMAVFAVAFRLSRRMNAPVWSPSFAIPSRRDLDARLVAGATIFGVGWGLGGFCPGPAITSLASGSSPVAIFVASMVAGMYLHAAFAARTAAPPSASAVFVESSADA